MENREYVLNLYDIYKKLLTETEIKYFEYYFFEDYSLSEIAEFMDVSKAYVNKVVNNVTKKLNDYENKLEFYNKTNKIKELIVDEKLKCEIEKIL